MIKAIIFDCFGVILTDSLDAVLGSLKASESQVKKAKDVVMALCWGRLTTEEATLQTAEILGVSSDQFRHLISSNEVKNEALLTLIKSLRLNYKTAMLSNVSADGIYKRFKPEELSELFDAVVASGEIGIAKPDPRAYQYVLDKLDVQAKQAIFTDDRQDFCDAAAGVGISSILYKTFPEFENDLKSLLAADTDS